MQTLWDLISWRATESPDAVAVGDDRGVGLTCAQLRDEVAHLAGRLGARGIGPGTRVSWVLSSRGETSVFVSGLGRVGAVQNPIVAIYGEPEIEFITAQVGSEYLVTPGVFRTVDFA